MMVFDRFHYPFVLHPYGVLISIIGKSLVIAGFTNFLYSFFEISVLTSFLISQKLLVFWGKLLIHILLVIFLAFRKS